MLPREKYATELVLAGEVLKRRRLMAKQSVETGPHHESEPNLARKKNRIDRWRGVFRRLNELVPRVGSSVIDPSEAVFGEISGLCSGVHVQHVEACRGTERFRIPKVGVMTDHLPLRQTIVMHRETGKIQECGTPERWLTLSQRQRIRKNVPAKMCLTLFGSEPQKDSPVRESMSSSSSGKEIPPESRKRKGDSEGDAEKKPRGPDRVELETSVGGEVRDEEPPILGYPPRNIARHGPGFLELSAEDRQWFKGVHHRMGHPDPETFARYMKNLDMSEKWQRAALDFQCDACTESRVGLDATKVGAIHEDIGFNHTVGVDVAFWTSSAGVVYPFVHILDEGTLFHVARPCQNCEDASGQLRIFEDAWVSWAGNPKMIYVDPAKEYLGRVWEDHFGAEGYLLKVSAADSHWQLGRVEAHGSTIKDMLARIDQEIPICDHEMFRRALIQACNAKNMLSRVAGYSPEQAVLGVSRRLPGSVVSDDGAISHLHADGEGPESDRFKQVLDLRTSARKAFIESDNSSSLRRALLRRSRPLRCDFEVGDLVLYWRRKGGNLRRERGRWYGPARVILVEGRKVIWLVHAAKLIRASPEQLRAASMREWKVIRDQPEHQVPAQEWARRIQHQDFADLGDDVPGEAERAEPEVEVESTGSPEPEREMSRDVSENPEMAPAGAREEVDPVEVPVPEDDDDLLFGDTVDWSFRDGRRVWELDVTPPVERMEQILGMEDLDPNECVLNLVDERKKRVEVKLRDLGEEDQRRFAMAKHKELKAWISHRTVRKVSRGKIPEHAIMRCRWLLTWKSPTGNENPEEISSNGKKAKARLIVIGWEDPQIDEIANDAPTLSKDGRQVVLQQIASHRWQLCSFDVSTAFLHGKGDGRSLGLHPVPEMRDALEMQLEDQVQLDGGAYGRVDAPYLWFCEFRDELVRQGCVQCPLDPCVFGYYSKGVGGEMVLEGCLGIHVDDGIAGGSAKFRAMIKRVEERFKFGSFEEGEFVYTGIHFRQWDDGSIEYDQIKYVEKIRPIVLEKGRKEDPEALVSEVERTELRRIIGALQYASVHSRPDISAKVGELQSAVTKARVKDLLLANKVLQEAKENPMTLMVLPVDPTMVTFCAFSDASFASTKENAAHQGSLIFVTTPELLDNKRAVVAPIAWSSKRVPRVVRSTLGAESAALSYAVDRLMWLRLLWAWLMNPDCDWKHPEKFLPGQNQAGLVTDCKSAYDLLTRTAVPQCAEHRTTIECLLIRERILENCRVRWVSSQAMLADCLTKSMDASVLRACLKSGRYCLRDEHGLLKERADQKQRLKWIKEMKETPPACQEAEPTQPIFVQETREDFWKIGPGKEVIRVHVRPRRQKFSPVGSLSCPVDIHELAVRRVTVRENGKEEADFWTGTLAHQRSDTPWTGYTKFFKKEVKGV